ncbi:MAG: hypothetical protein WCV62_00150 [Candidatus Peribacteraceae bacterium]|jgi:isopropylmalate/homocitrate/citramalate synthase
MTDQQPPQTTGLKIPPDVAATYGPLVALIKASESMNDEERQYWVNILPVMTPEQVKNLQEILENEKAQLAAIDKKYAQEMGKIEQGESLKKAEDERRKMRETRTAAETSHRETEDKATEDILRQIEGQGGN